MKRMRVETFRIIMAYPFKGQARVIIVMYEDWDTVIKTCLLQFALDIGASLFDSLLASKYPTSIS